MRAEISPTPITRIAPSPTGLFHVGTARTALFNWLFARKYGGRFLVRIEDTDRERSKPEFERNILEGLAWLGLDHDGDVVRQSDRIERYRARLEEIVASGAAYVSKEPAKDDPSRTVEVVRLKNPGRTLMFHDEVRGDITFDTTELGDFVIARSLNDPLYHFAVVVDDGDAGITHVIRGEDHISNTPRQILIQEALGMARPIYAHLPMILAPDRSKMSKRKGATSMTEYRKRGYLPGAMLNYLALLGWNPGDEREVFTPDELVQAFTLDGLQKGGAIFDIEKLKWLNREHRTMMKDEEVRAQFLTVLADRPALLAVCKRSPHALGDMIERYAIPGDLVDAVAAGEFSFYEERPRVDIAQVAWKKDPAPQKIGERLNRLTELLDAVEAATYTYDNVKSAVFAYAESEGRGSVLWPLRFVLSGRERSPDPFVLLEALGKDESLARLRAAAAACGTHSV